MICGKKKIDQLVIANKGMLIAYRPNNVKSDSSKQNIIAKLQRDTNLQNLLQPNSLLDIH